MEFRLGFSMWRCMVPYYGFYHVGLTMGYSVGLGLRYRLFWLWVFRWVFPMRHSVGLGLRYRLFWLWVFRLVFPMSHSVGLGLRHRLLWFGC